MNWNARGKKDSNRKKGSPGIYNHAYFEYNISMIVKNQDPLQTIQAILKERNGTLFTSDLSRQKVPRTYLSILEKKGEIQRVSRGVYAATNTIVDDLASLQARYQRAIFSHETALFLHDLTDRTPLFYTVTVPSGYNATSLKTEGIKVFYVQRKLYRIGLITIKSPHGNNIQTFDLERTICDLLRSRHQIDIQFVNDALKRYVIHPSRNIDQLFGYARQFRIQTIVRETIEVLS